MVRIDLGCGTNKQLGFIGVDRYPLPGVDVIANLDEPLPFPTDSVDLVFASHSLEHVKSLLATMKEIYRICKHGAQLSVLAPYSEQKLNIANPYHTWRFNEHAPRFWTSYSKAPIDPEEFNHQYASQWGLSRSDNSEADIDIRLARMECFYFPQYVLLPTCEQRRLRQERMDVCDQILFHLIVWKGDERIWAKSFDAYLNEFQPYEPNSLAVLRQRGTEALVRKQTLDLEESHSLLADLRQQLADATTGAARDRDQAVADAAVLKSELTLLRLTSGNEQSGAKEELRELRARLATFTEEFTRMTKICVDQTEVIRQTTTELRDTAAYNRVLRDEVAQVGSELEFARVDLLRESARLTELQGEASSLRETCRALEARSESQALLTAKLALTQAELDATAALFGLERQKEELLNLQVAAATRESAASSHEAERWKEISGVARRSLGSLYDEIRTTRPALVRAAGFVIGRRRQQGALRDAFVPLRNYCDQHFGSGRASLVLGGDLNQVPYREYEIPFDLDCLNSVCLAIRPLLPGSSGSAGIEIVSSESEILVQTLRPLDAIQPGEITEFRLPVPLTRLKKTWWLRVFVRGAEDPVPIYELAQGALFRVVTQFYPFVSFK
jgi:SAM-dependent methyltransferase